MATEGQMLKQQEMENAVHDRNYTKAVALGFELMQPNRLRQLFEQILQQKGSQGGAQGVQRALVGLDAERLKQCLDYVREWNTNAKFCHVAGGVLAGLLRVYPPSVITALPQIQVGGAKILRVDPPRFHINHIRMFTGHLHIPSGVQPAAHCAHVASEHYYFRFLFSDGHPYVCSQDIFTSLQAYNQRHFARMDRMVRAAHLLDFTLASMSVLESDDALLDAPASDDQRQDDDGDREVGVAKVAGTVEVLEEADGGDATGHDRENGGGAAIEAEEEEEEDEMKKATTAATPASGKKRKTDEAGGRTPAKRVAAEGGAKTPKSGQKNGKKKIAQ
jgi:hypothetical protein